MTAQNDRDITGAFGTIRNGESGGRRTPLRRLLTFLAILGPGLIVMVGDNDAGAFSTYAQAGQNYGTSLLWTLPLLIPVLYVNQEMVLRLGAVTGVGHARLILARFGRFWGAFSVIDLFLLNALTIVTEFIGIALALQYFGLPKIAGVVCASLLIAAGAFTGSFRRFERFAITLSLLSLLLIPVLIAVHAPMGETMHGFIVPGMPRGSDPSTVMLLICAIVGTTIAPWQLFFQQSYVIDKRITPSFLSYERWDLVTGIVFVILGAVAIMSIAAKTFAGHPEFGAFADAGAVAAGIRQYAGAWPGACFALALLDASIIGASAVSLSTAYAVGDLFALRHSLHRKPSDAPAFYALYVLLIAGAAALVLIPGVPLGLLTNAVQVLAGVLLPSATVFLLLLCSDRDVLGPWANSAAVNAFAALVIAVLVMLSVILTCSTLFGGYGQTQIVWTLAGGIGASLLIAGWTLRAQRNASDASNAMTIAEKRAWRMPRTTLDAPAAMSAPRRLWLIILRFYLLAATVLVIIKVAALALAA